MKLYQNSFINAFPTPAKDYIRHYAKTENVSESLVATTVLAVMSTASQQAVRIESENGSQQPVSLSLQIIAKSSAGKTSTFQNIVSPLQKVLDTKNITNSDFHTKYEADENIWKIQEQALKKEIREAVIAGLELEPYQLRYSELLKQRPILPQKHTLYITAGSSEGIEDYLIKNNGCGLWVHDETLTHVTPRSMAQQIQLFDGSPIKVSLRSKKNIELSKPALTMLYMSQPKPFADYSNTKTGKLARSKGYEARKLTDWADNYQQPIHRTSTWDSLAYDSKQFEVLLAEKFNESLQISEPKLIKLSGAAKNSWLDIKTDIQRTVETDFLAKQISDIASKGAQQIIRIAGILHFMSTDHNEISVDSIERAWRIYAHYISGAQAYYALDHQPPGQISDATTLYQFLDGHFNSMHHFGINSNCITFNALKAHGPFNAHNTARLWAALELLQDNRIISIQGNSTKSIIFFHAKHAIQIAPSY